MPSAEEFAPRPGGGTMTPQRMEELRARARAVRHAQATGTPIPGTGMATTAPAPSQPAYEPPEQGWAAETAVAAYTTDEELELVRKRFKLANYYEALLEQPAFGDDVYSDPYAATVQAELTEWVKGRMSELVGIRNNPEGFLDDEVQLLKSLAQSLGSNGVKALVFLADRVLNPPTPAPVFAPPAPSGVQPTAPAPEPEPEEDEGSSAMSLSVAPTPAPAPAAPAAPPQVSPAKARAPRVRRARVPGAAVASQAAPPAQAQAEAPAAAPQKRTRKRSSDPLAAGRALVASQGQPDAESAPAPAQAAPAAPTIHPAPVPMPHGLGMTMAMEQKAGEALRDAKVIEATGAGVM